MSSLILLFCAHLSTWSSSAILELALTAGTTIMRVISILERQIFSSNCEIRCVDYIGHRANDKSLYYTGCNQWRIQGEQALNRGHAPPRWRPGSWSFSSFNVSYEYVNMSLIISGHRKWPHLAIKSILWKRPSNREQITWNSSLRQ